MHLLMEDTISNLEFRKMGVQNIHQYAISIGTITAVQEVLFTNKNMNIFAVAA